MAARYKIYRVVTHTCTSCTHHGWNVHDRKHGKDVGFFSSFEQARETFAAPRWQPWITTTGR